LSLDALDVVWLAYVVSNPSKAAAGRGVPAGNGNLVVWRRNPFTGATIAGTGASAGASLSGVLTD